MPFLNSFFTWVIKKRVHQIDLFKQYPHEVQREVMLRLVSDAKNTEFGEKHNFGSIKSYNEFKETIPVSTYEEVFPYIERMMKGEQNVLWPTHINWFAKSSGTTNAKSKFIPVSQEALDESHFSGGKDLLAIYVDNNPDSLIFTGKGLSIGGSHQKNLLNPSGDSYFGDVSAVIMQNMPLWAKYVRTPSEEVALLDSWEEKLEKIAQETVDENVTSMAGVPTWTLLVLKRIMELKGTSNILDVWPNLEVFFHGAVAFGPYKQVFKELIPSNDIAYIDAYNASEGFFGIQDRPDSVDMLLMLDYGIFYEFIPMSVTGLATQSPVPLWEVEVGKNYAMIISTNAGLWRYNIGDTVRFTSIDPYRIKISGRTKHFINAFGEELVIENAEEAIAKTCEATNSIIENFTAGPIYLEKNKRGGHEWIIEFEKKPESLTKFATLLDKNLKKLNSDYEAKRQNDLALVEPKVHSAPVGTFYKWMKLRNKLGGQNKVPRLSNNRSHIDSILGLLEDIKIAP
ncbi:MAG: GH3 auxin-responsive promoter family protein [Cyclobacteriaceae bacterium]|nr:GH3 auxin-responsive promoter family protein [Cyclobacteriaceae bacterium]